MSESHNVLKMFVNGKSQFFDLPDGATETVKFLSAESITTHFQGKPIESIRYHFEINGKEMLWDRSSRELAKQMSIFSEGDILSIRRTGQKNQTKYEIKKV